MAAGVAAGAAAGTAGCGCSATSAGGNVSLLRDAIGLISDFVGAPFFLTCLGSLLSRAAPRERPPKEQARQLEPPPLVGAAPPRQVAT